MLQNTKNRKQRKKPKRLFRHRSSPHRVRQMCRTSLIKIPVNLLLQYPVSNPLYQIHLLLHKHLFLLHSNRLPDLFNSLFNLKRLYSSR